MRPNCRRRCWKRPAPVKQLPLTRMNTASAISSTLGWRALRNKQPFAAFGSFALARTFPVWSLATSFDERYATMSAPIRVLDVVALTEDLPQRRLCRGQVGTVVEELAPGVFEVEFSDDNGHTYANL